MKILRKIFFIAYFILFTLFLLSFTLPKYDASTIFFSLYCPTFCFKWPNLKQIVNILLLLAPTLPLHPLLLIMCLTQGSEGKKYSRWGVIDMRSICSLFPLVFWPGHKKPVLVWYITGTAACTQHTAAKLLFTVQLLKDL